MNLSARLVPILFCDLYDSAEEVEERSGGGLLRSARSLPILFLCAGVKVERISAPGAFPGKRASALSPRRRFLVALHLVRLGWPATPRSVVR